MEPCHMANAGQQPERMIDGGRNGVSLGRPSILLAGREGGALRF